MSPPAAPKCPPGTSPKPRVSAVEQSVIEELEALAERVPLRRTDDGVGWTEAWGVRDFDSRWVLEATHAVRATMTVEVDAEDVVPDEVYVNVERGDYDLSYTVSATGSLVSVEDGRATYEMEAE